MRGLEVLGFVVSGFRIVKTKKFFLGFEWACSKQSGEGVLNKKMVLIVSSLRLKLECNCVRVCLLYRIGRLGG
jgi:hypothetical protein